LKNWKKENKMTEKEKRCYGACGYYDSKVEGCRYAFRSLGWFEAVEPGQGCPHPESFLEKVILIDLAAFCNILAYD